MNDPAARTVNDVLDTVAITVGPVMLSVLSMRLALLISQLF